MFRLRSKYHGDFQVEVESYQSRFDPRILVKDLLCWMLPNRSDPVTSIAAYMLLEHFKSTDKRVVNFSGDRRGEICSLYLR